MIFYCGIRTSQSGGQRIIKVDENGKFLGDLSPEPSQKLDNHSPDGFQWSYRGSGCAQTALAILLDVTQDEKESLFYSQDFKDDFVAQWGDRWTLSEQTVKDWLLRQKGRVTMKNYVN